MPPPTLSPSSHSLPPPALPSLNLRRRRRTASSPAWRPSPSPTTAAGSRVGRGELDDNGVSQGGRGQGARRISEDARRWGSLGTPAGLCLGRKEERGEAGSPRPPWATEVEDQELMRRQWRWRRRRIERAERHGEVPSPGRRLPLHCSMRHLRLLAGPLPLLCSSRIRASPIQPTARVEMAGVG
jgi:hypothetical protein